MIKEVYYLRTNCRHVAVRVASESDITLTGRGVSKLSFDLINPLKDSVIYKAEYIAQKVGISVYFDRAAIRREK